MTLSRFMKLDFWSGTLILMRAGSIVFLDLWCLFSGFDMHLFCIRDVCRLVWWRMFRHMWRLFSSFMTVISKMCDSHCPDWWRVCSGFAMLNPFFGFFGQVCTWIRGWRFRNFLPPLPGGCQAILRSLSSLKSWCQGLVIDQIIKRYVEKAVPKDRQCSSVSVQISLF